MYVDEGVGAVVFWAVVVVMMFLLPKWLSKGNRMTEDAIIYMFNTVVTLAILYYMFR